LRLAFLTVGGQMVSATENALINTLETPLAVGWVWVCFSEAPSVPNFAGGMIVMAAVVGHVWHSSHSKLATAAT
jgi:drug/metabolite transporter (DMT)-like permease